MIEVRPLYILSLKTNVVNIATINILNSLYKVNKINKPNLLISRKELGFVNLNLSDNANFAIFYDYSASVIMRYVNGFASFPNAFFD